MLRCKMIAVHSVVMAGMGLIVTLDSCCWIVLQLSPLLPEL